MIEGITPVGMRQFGMSVGVVNAELAKVPERTAAAVSAMREQQVVQQELSKGLQTLLDFAEGSNGQFASEGFAFGKKTDAGGNVKAGDKSGGAILFAYANELLMQYVQLMERLTTQVDDATRIMGPGLAESMGNLENLFMKIFPQLGSLESLAREYIKKIKSGTEQVAADAAQVRQQIVVAASDAGLSASSMMRGPAAPPPAKTPTSTSARTPTPATTPPPSLRVPTHPTPVSPTTPAARPAANPSTGRT